MKNNIPKQHRNKGGVYILRSTVTDDSYIGATGNLRIRATAHYGKSNLSSRKKIAKYLSVYGTETLSMELLAVINDRVKRMKRERYLIKKLQPTLNTLLKK